MRLTSAFVSSGQYLTIHDTHPRWHSIEMATEYGSQQAMILRTRTDMNSFVEHNADFLSQMALSAFPHTEREIGRLDIPGLTEENFLYCEPLLRRTRDDLHIDDIRVAYNLRSSDFTIVVTDGDGNGGWAADLDDFLSVVLDVFRRTEEGHGNILALHNTTNLIFLEQRAASQPLANLPM